MEPLALEALGLIFISADVSVAQDSMRSSHVKATFIALALDFLIFCSSDTCAWVKPSLLSCKILAKAIVDTLKIF